MDTFLLFIAMSFLLLFSAYCSGSEAALFSLPTTRIKAFQFDSNPRKRLIASLLMHPRDLLVTVFMLNTLANILLQNSAANLFGDLSSWMLKVVFPLILTLLFGEIFPKYLALQNNVTVSYYIAPSIHFFTKLLKPLRQAAVALTTPLSRFFFFYLKDEPSLSQEEVQHILKTSKEYGVFNSEEGEMLTGYLQLQDSIVKELMRPREEILYYDMEEEPLTHLVYLFTDRERSRIPICKGDLDNILGVISSRLYFLHASDIKDPKELLPYLEKPFYIPESMEALQLLDRFQETKHRLALVVDEYGSISGLITEEDLFQRVVGRMMDIKNKNERFTRAGENEIIASSKMELTQFNEIFHSSLISPGGMVTIGGWLTECLGEIPKQGSQFELEGFLFQILSATPSRLRRLYIRKL